jgi:hypothetical protein
MAQKFLTNIDLNGNQLLNSSLEKLATAPTGFEGRMYYDTQLNIVRVYANGAWKKSVHSITSGGGVGIAEALEVSDENGIVTLTLKVADTNSAGLIPAAMWQMLTDATDEATASKLVKRDAQSNIKVATPTDANHAATKGYVDAARQGLDVKQSVRLATTAPINIATDLEAGDTIDGVTLVAGDRVLVKDQSTATENGIYVVVAAEAGAASRSSDANGTVDTGELKAGTFAFVEEGSTHSDKGFVVSTNGTITIGSTAIVWTQFSGAGSFTAGDGISQNGNTINVNVVNDRTAITGDAVDIASTYVGQTSITTLGIIAAGTWEATDVAVLHGGTGSSTAADARTALGIKTSATTVTTGVSKLARVASQGCAASVSSVSTTVVTHSFDTQDVIVQIYEVSTGNTVYGDINRGTNDSVTVVLQGTIALGDYKIIVTG